MNADLGYFSYLLAGASFSILAVLTAVGWRGGAKATLFVAAVVIHALWGFALAYAELHPMHARLVLPFETARYAVWCAFVSALVVGAGHRMMSGIYLVGVHSLLVVGCGGVVLGWLRWDGMMPLRSEAFIGLLCLSIAGLVLVEQVLRNTETNRRWVIKYLALGLGLVFALDIYVFSHAVLVKTVNPHSWIGRGVASMVAVPMLAIAAARNPGWSVDIFVSRRAVFFTGALVVSAVYLIAVAAAGYYIRDFGGSWGHFGQLVLVSIATTLLISLALSSRLRVISMRFLSRHFYSYRYDYRNEWLRLIGTLDEEKELRPAARAIKGMAQIVDSPGGGYWERDRDGNFSCAGTWNAETSTELVSPLVIHELSSETRPLVMSHHTQLFGSIGIADAWLLIPLLKGREWRGFVVLREAPLADRTLGWEEEVLLITVGRQVASFLMQHEAAASLARARQFEAYNKLAAFVVHDLRNVISQQELVVDNAERLWARPEFARDALQAVRQSVIQMRQLLEKISARDACATVKRLELINTLRTAVHLSSSREPIPRLVTGCECIVAADPDGLVGVIRHLIRNAQEATSANGRVTVCLRADGRMAVISIEDDGCGMDEEFVKYRLFVPFETTKGRRGMGVGAYQAKEFVAHAGGAIEVVSHVGRGTRIDIRLPLVAAWQAEEQQHIAVVKHG